jgi:hypothetical protein
MDVSANVLYLLLRKKNVPPKRNNSLEKMVNFYETNRRQITQDRHVIASSVGCGSLTNHRGKRCLDAE